MVQHRDRKRSTPFRTSTGGNCNRQGVKVQVEVEVGMTGLYTWTKNSELFLGWTQTTFVVAGLLKHLSNSHCLISRIRDHKLEKNIC